ncbi:MAG: iron ABC transporter permease [Candidatus Methanomethylophilus sp.]|jgi:iron complex transport system permease protein|nr:iron ABC transporter permease [Methanomethylophilus sp.]MCI2093703.1 iron ABC transporter permease [Methanomethylophilus sp.]WII09020.1 iron ABC transporter permease [Methanomassiliicoccales archaeon LGM-DZ1]
MAGSVETDPLIGDIVRESILSWDDAGPDKKKEQVLDGYRRYYARRWIFISACAAALIVLSGVSLTIGDYKIDFFRCFSVVWEHITGNVGTSEEARLQDYVIWNLRLTTVCGGIIAGVALSICGVAMQSILKNPLADPYTTGVSSGAGFGATLAIVAGSSVVTDQYAVVGNAFIFALVPTAVILAVAKIKNSSPATMIMAGVAVMYVFNALSTIIKLWGDPNSLSAILEWQVGSIGGISWKNLTLMFFATVIGLIIIQSLARELNVLATGEDSAKALGLDVERLRNLTMIVVALLAAAIVSFTGLIGFVGLIAPHAARIIIGADNRYLVPASALLGAVVLISAEIVGKTLMSPSVIPVGVITSLLGGPIFLWLLLRRKSEVWG